MRIAHEAGFRPRHCWPLLALTLLFSACDDELDGGSDGENAENCWVHGDHLHCEGDNAHPELITMVRLTFTPTGGGDSVVAEWDDPDGRGGASGSSEPIVLTQGVEYEVSVFLMNALEDPPEDVTPEIRAEAEDHMVLYYGEGVRGPASRSTTALIEQSYADVESDYIASPQGGDLPVGLESVVVATNPGESELRMMLRHMPAVNGNETKTADLPQMMAESEDLPGGVDADVKYVLRVEPGPP